MPSDLPDLLFNPFGRRVVDRPRKIGATVDTLNGKIIRNLQREFGALLEDPIPRPRPTAEQIQFVVSPDPGYGKSHLLGRLFQQLDRQATRVYVSPFTDPSNAWASLLSRIVQEMSMPEHGDAEFVMPGAPTQLDAFAQAVLGRAFAALVKARPKLAPADPSVLDAIQSLPLDGWDMGDPSNKAATWVRTLTEMELNEAASLLSSMHASLQPGSSASAWLRVLFFYAIDRENALRRGACLEWLEAKVHRSDISDLGLSPRDALDDDADRARRNEEARSRVLDFCSLAGLFRPFVLAFDQTETYGQTPELSKTIGQLLCDLYNDAPNQLTIFTANQDKWEKDIKPNMDDAHVERFSWPKYLDEITREQADQLARQRLIVCDVSPPEIERFVDDDWLEGAVRGGGVSVRKFLEAAALRFSELVESAIEDNADLDELFKMEKLTLSSQRARLSQYRADLYQWCLRDVVNSVEGSNLKAKVFKSHRDYLPLAWPGNEQYGDLLFGFEDRDNHRTWHAIATEADRQHSDHDGNSRCILFRLPHHSGIPADNWKVAPYIREVQASCMYIHVIDESQNLMMHALWELYCSACQGDIDASPRDVLEFAAKHLQSWWNELRSATGAGGGTSILDKNAPDAELVEAIRNIVKQKRFLGEEKLMNALGESLTKPPGVADVRELCESYISEIRVHISPTTAAYIWQS